MGIGIGLTLALGRGGVVPFNAAQAPGLVADWDFTDATKLYTDSGTTLVSSNADVVGQINDKSGNGYHLRQTDGTAKGTYRTGQVNGYPIVRLDGVNDYYQCISAASTFNFLHRGNSSVYVVLKSALASGSVAYFIDNISLAGSIGSRYGYYWRPDYRTGSGFTQAIVNVLKGTSITLVANSNSNLMSSSSFFLASSLCEPNNATAANKQTWRKNGGTAQNNNVATGTTDSTQSASYALCVGATGGDQGSPFPADLVSILIYNQLHGTTHRQYVENGLIRKFAIS